MPDASLMVELDRSEHCVASMCIAQFVFFSRDAVGPDENPTAVSYPLRIVWWSSFRTDQFMSRLW